MATDGRFNRMLSAEELTFCCKNCGSGCQGGYPIEAWTYFRRYGVVTGGDYDSNEVRQPTKRTDRVEDRFPVTKSLGGAHIALEKPPSEKIHNTVTTRLKRKEHDIKKTIVNCIAQM